jgi:hypothetical protein
MENEKINKEASRASQTRAKDVRKKVWSPPSSLDAPPAPAGFRHRWLRAESMGFNDTKNIAGRLRSGYELVRADQYPEALTIHKSKTANTQGVIGVGGLVLARIPEEIAKQYSDHYAQKGKDQDAAVR